MNNGLFYYLIDGLVVNVGSKRRVFWPDHAITSNRTWYVRIDPVPEEICQAIHLHEFSEHFTTRYNLASSFY